MRVSIITALFNEEDSIPSLLSNYAELLKLSPPECQYEFLFVNDGSRDNSLNLLTSTLLKEWDYKVLTHSVNLGFGAALRTGIEAASGEIIVCYDADSTYPVEDILKLVNKINDGWDIASANPFHGRKVIERVPLWRQGLTRLNAGLYKVALGKAGGQVGIFSCAFRAYRREVIQSISFTSNGFGAASEILGRLILKKYNVIEIPSSLSTRQFGESKMNVRKAVGEHLRNVILFLRIKYLKH